MKEHLRFALHLLIHPFDGFWDMKREKKGRLWFALVCLLLLPAVFLMRQQATGFLFNRQMNRSADVLAAVNYTGVFVFLFCAANWCVTTLMKGEGRMADIVMVAGYSAIPFAMIQIPLSIASNYFTYAQTEVYLLFHWISILWFAVLVFLGIMTVHQYTVFKTICTLLLTAAGMIMMAFIAMIFYNLLSQMSGFLISIFHEIRLRL